MNRKYPLRQLIDMLAAAHAARAQDREDEIRQTIDWRLNHLYWTTPPEVHSSVGLYPL